MASNNKSAGQWSADLVYDAFLWTFSIIIELFFREVHPRSTWKVPRTGPVIIVAAPHANQFVDPLILMRVLRMDAHRRVCFLIAAKSMQRAFIGWGAGLVGSVPVGRALDLKKPADGKIYLPDPENDPTLVRGVDTNFEDPKFTPNGLLVLPSVNNEAASTEIKDIVSPTEIRLKKPFKGAIAMRQLTGQDVRDANGNVLEGDVKAQNVQGFQGTKFSYAPHVDQSKVYAAVFQKLREDGCIGIFPEGGSHDRTELLPLKPGVAIMALGALAEDPNCNVKIVPCGMNYFHAHKFRSRAVVEFGTPVEIPPELVEMYKRGERREAVGQVLETVYQALVAVTVTSPDYDTLMLIQAVRRLYNPQGKKLPLPVIVELNRRLVKGYTTYKDDPRVVSLKQSVLAYNKQLMQLNVRDHQISYAKFSIIRVVYTLLYRITKLALLSLAVLPGTVLFSPVFIAGKIISIRKAREALAASSVKIQARDVVATWKLLVAMALAPALYTVYTILLTYWTYRNRINGRMPDWVPLWAVVCFGYSFFPTITFAALRFGEIGMDIVKSLRPLLLSLSPRSQNTFYKLRKQREELVQQVTDAINDLGPELFPDFDHQRLVADPQQTSSSSSRPTTPRSRSRPRTDSAGLRMTSESPVSPITASKMAAGGGGAGGGDSGTAQRSGQANTNAQLPRNESFHNLGGISLFATRPGTPTRSRSRTSSGSGLTALTGAFTATNTTGANSGNSGKPQMKGLTSMDSKAGFDEVSQKIRGAMRERGRRRRSEDLFDNAGANAASSEASSSSVGPGGGWEFADRETDSPTPGSEVEPHQLHEAKKEI